MHWLWSGGFCIFRFGQGLAEVFSEFCVAALWYKQSLSQQAPVQHLYGPPPSIPTRPPYSMFPGILNPATQGGVGTLIYLVTLTSVSVWKCYICTNNRITVATRFIKTVILHFFLYKLRFFTPDVRLYLKAEL